jgi:hypothetical protein
MKKQYLHLSAYHCDRCDGPVVSGSIAIRENTISRETEVREMGAMCLACGNKQGKAIEGSFSQHCAPLEWRSGKPLSA